MIIEMIDEVVAFQASLKAKRLHRLAQERQDLQRNLKATEATIKAESDALDAKMRYLGEHRALDEYVAVTQKLAKLQLQIARLEESKSVREKVMVRQLEIKLELAEHVPCVSAAVLESVSAG